MTSLTTLVDGIDFGEGPRWHDGKLWYSDFYQHTVYTVDLDGKRNAVVTIDDQPSGLGWLPDGSLLIVAMEQRKVLRLDGSTVSFHADLSDFTPYQCNDMVVDDRGNAYVGHVGYDFLSKGFDEAQPASLALVSPEGEVTEAADNLLFPNGAVITEDGSTLIVGETLGARYTAFTISENGSLSNRRTWADVQGHFPDGCTLDVLEGIWFADPSGGGLLRVVEGGEITDRIPTQQPAFACALGGPAGTTLFALTAPGVGAEPNKGKAGGALLIADVEHPHAGRP